MINCYVCGIEIDNSNRTVEHIFLNSIGGRLKSDKLICRKCNTEFGSDVDSELSEQLNPICNMLNINRDRGNPQPISVQEKESGEKWLLGPGGKPIMVKPSIQEQNNGEQKHIQVVARSMQEARRIMKGLRKKYPQLDIEQEMKKASLKSEYLDKHFEFGFNIGGEKAFRSICKTAVNFYILHGGELDKIEHLVPYIKNGQGSNYVWFYDGGSAKSRWPNRTCDLFKG